MQRSKPAGYPKELRTVGDHIRAWRMDSGLRIVDVARMLGVTEDTVINWEFSRSMPGIRMMPAIIQLLRYMPMEIDTSALSRKLRYYRILNGLSQKKFAEFLGVDKTTIRHWENGQHKPMPTTLKKLENLIVF